MNPFVYGEKVSGENFCNRQQEIKELISEISSGQKLMIYSPRRYGKTSLISIVLKKVEEKGLIPLYIDLYPVMSNEDFVRISLKYLSQVLSLTSKNLLKKMKTFFKRISPSLTLTVSEAGTPSFGINFTKTEILPAGGASICLTPKAFNLSIFFSFVSDFGRDFLSKSWSKKS